MVARKIEVLRNTLTIEHEKQKQQLLSIAAERDQILQEKQDIQ